MNFTLIPNAKQLPTTAGIYRLTSPSGKKYIGQANNLAERVSRYQRDARRCRQIIHKAIRRYGWQNFTIEVAECPKTELNAVEQKTIAACNTLYPYGYNQMTGGGKNMTVSEQTRRKLRQSRIKAAAQMDKSFYQTAEYKEKISAAGKNVPKSAEHRRKIGEANKGRTVSDGTRQKIIAARLPKKNINACRKWWIEKAATVIFPKQSKWRFHGSPCSPAIIANKLGISKQRLYQRKDENRLPLGVEYYERAPYRK